MMNQDEDLQALETTVRAMEWETVSFEPSQAEVQALDQQLPAEWVQPLEQEAEFSQDELQALMDAPLDVPEGDIDKNAHQALSELDVDMQAIMQELDHAPALDLPEISHDEHDFGR
jgi:hypothetical protein